MFKAAALTVLEEARRASALSEYDTVIQQIAIRLTYARNTSEVERWQHQEMREIANQFLAYTPIDLESAKERAKNWHNQSLESMKELRQIKNLLNLIKDTVDYLEQPQRHIIEEWLSVLPQLP